MLKERARILAVAHLPARPGPGRRRLPLRLLACATPSSRGSRRAPSRAGSTRSPSTCRCCRWRWRSGARCCSSGRYRSHRTVPLLDEAWAIIRVCVIGAVLFTLLLYVGAPRRAAARRRPHQPLLGPPLRRLLLPLPAHREARRSALTSRYVRVARLQLPHGADRRHRRHRARRSPSRSTATASGASASSASSRNGHRPERAAGAAAARSSASSTTSRASSRATSSTTSSSPSTAASSTAWRTSS